MLAGADVYDVDLTDGATFREAVPHEAFDALRAAGGVTWHEERSVPEAGGDGDLLTFVDSPGFWSVTSHAAREHACCATRSVFSSQLGGVFLPSLAPESLATFRQMMLNMDPPEHSRLRRILQPIFTPRAVERLHDSVDAQRARDRRRTSTAPTECDLVTAVSAELPLRVLADLLGMPREDRHLIFEWSNGLLGLEAGESAVSPGGEHELRSPRCSPTASRWPTPAGPSPRRHREPDRATPRSTASGSTTSSSACSGCCSSSPATRPPATPCRARCIALQEHDQWGWLAEHPEHLATAVEELLRYVSPVMHFRRTATRDTVLGDQQIRAGDKVVVWYGAANRDPAVFADPHGLDLLRDPNPHLAFGDGAALLPGRPPGPPGADGHARAS